MKPKRRFRYTGDSDQDEDYERMDTMPQPQSRSRSRPLLGFNSILDDIEDSDSESQRPKKIVKTYTASTFLGSNFDNSFDFNIGNTSSTGIGSSSSTHFTSSMANRPPPQVAASSPPLLPVARAAPAVEFNNSLVENFPPTASITLFQRGSSTYVSAVQEVPPSPPPRQERRAPVEKKEVNGAAFRYVDDLQFNNVFNCDPIVLNIDYPINPAILKHSDYRETTLDFARVNHMARAATDSLLIKGYCFKQCAAKMYNLKYFLEHVKAVMNMTHLCLNSVIEVNFCALMPDFIPFHYAMLALFGIKGKDGKTTVTLNKPIKDRKRHIALFRTALVDFHNHYKKTYRVEKITAPPGILKQGCDDSFRVSNRYKTARDNHSKYIFRVYDIITSISCNKNFGLCKSKESVFGAKSTTADIWLQFGYFTLVAKMLADYTQCMMRYGFIEKKNHPGNQFRMYCIAKMRNDMYYKTSNKAPAIMEENAKSWPVYQEFFTNFAQLDDTGFSPSCEECQVAYLNVKSFAIEGASSSEKKSVMTFSYSPCIEYFIDGDGNTQEIFLNEKKPSEEFIPYSGTYRVPVEIRAPKAVKIAKQRYLEHLKMINNREPINFTISELKRSL